MRLHKKLIREMIPSGDDHIFHYKKENSIWPAWHYHAEIDILLFLNYQGQHITGDYIGSFGPGTLLVNGPNIPHAFNSLSCQLDGAEVPAISVIQFSEQTIGAELLSKSEMTLIRNFIHSTNRSFEILGTARDRAAEIIQQIHDATYAHRLSLFLLLLETLALAPQQEKKPLVSEFYAPVLNENNISRIDIVRSWVLENICAKINLEEAAAQIHMRPKSFSQFFKKNTGKSFVQYIKELRIGLACQKLLETNLSIIEICYQSGFNNLSNFNRQFLDLKKMTPKDFRNRSKKII
ncbi:MAG: AraC family transcriptional regulator [Akkermansiaceae bacterium]